MATLTKVNHLFYDAKSLHPTDMEICVVYNERYDEYAICQYEENSDCYIHLDCCIPFDSTHWRKIHKYELTQMEDWII